MPHKRAPTSSIVEQHPILKAALEDALRRMPPDSHVHDLTDPMADYTLRFDLITRYDRKYLRDDPTARPPLQPIARTSGEWNAFLSDGDAAAEVEKALAKHEKLLTDVYAGKYA